MSRCPVCGLTGGFHTDASEVETADSRPGWRRWYIGHAAARSFIPAHLRRPGNKAERRAEITRRLANRPTSHPTTTKE